VTDRPARITARSVAAQVLARVDQDAAFAAATLDAELSRAVQLEPRDRALATELAYGTLRVRPWLDARIGRHAKKGIAGLPPKARAHLEIGAYQLFFLARVPAFAAVNEAVDGVRAAGGPKVAAFANAVLRALGREAASEAGEAGEASATARLEEAVVASAAPWLASGAGAPPLGIRVGSPGARDEWIARLREATPDATFDAGRVSPLAILARGAGKPHALPGWADGAWTIQEEGSQLVALALGARDGDKVLDACAGRGNKTSLLAAQVGPRGAVDAADLHASKLEALERDVARLKLTVRGRHAVDWSAGSGDVPRDFDRVLVDAPCSGTGTLGRRPDLQTRRSAENLATLSALQRTILQRASEHVRPGGRLVYAVCSVLREEAEDVTAAFLAARPDFVPTAFDSPEARAISEAQAFRLLPHVHGTDGYYIASFSRPE
jgi:16S rRNA (cytosine967-C5)-methyltransferase